MKRRIVRAVLWGAVFMGLLSFVPDVLFWVRTAPVHPVGGFDFAADRPAFANETVWHYADGSLQAIGLPDEEQVRRAGDGGERYTRRCFVLARAVLQFKKFVRFEPDVAPVDEDELVRRVRRIASTSVWRAPFSAGSRIVIPGYESLHEFSAAHPDVLRGNLGAGWPTYLRVGNMPIIRPPSRDHQRRTFDFTLEIVKSGSPVVLWLCNFPSLNINHTVLAYEVEPGPSGTFLFTVYDPNDTTEPKTLTYHPEAQTFTFQSTFYFKGGPVRIRPVYLSPFQ